MMMPERNESDLYELCLGSGSPAEYLLGTGRLPEGWTDRYLAILDRAAAFWRGKASIPKRIVAAVHFASGYLHFRYQAWKHLSKIPANPATETELIRIRTRSEDFLLREAVA